MIRTLQLWATHTLPVVLGVSSRDSSRDTEAGDPRYLGSGERQQGLQDPALFCGDTHSQSTQSNRFSSSKALVPAQCLFHPVDPRVLRSTFPHEPTP